MSRILDKIEELEKYLDQLEKIMPDNFEEYNSSFEKKLACERIFEKIIEASVDLVFLVIKERGYDVPESDKNAFEILKDNRVIDERLCEELKGAKGIRNILAHQYGNIDDKLVFETINSKLFKDVNELISCMRGEK